jgi:hypothetical protein
MVIFEVFGLIADKDIKGILKNSSARLSLKTKNLFFWGEKNFK